MRRRGRRAFASSMCRSPRTRGCRRSISGALDLECGSTTANAERARTVAFSPVFFLAGTKLMVPLGRHRGHQGASYRDLAGRTVVVGAGTTNAEVMRRLAGSVSPPIAVMEANGLDAAYGMLAAGTVDAFASDDILLDGFIATRPDGGRFGIVGDYLSYEPYAITLAPGRSRLCRTGPRQLRTHGERGDAEPTLRAMVPRSAAQRRNAQPSHEPASGGDVPGARPARLATRLAASRLVGRGRWRHGPIRVRVTVRLEKSAPPPVAGGVGQGNRAKQMRSGFHPEPHQRLCLWTPPRAQPHTRESNGLCGHGGV